MNDSRLRRVAGIAVAAGQEIIDVYEHHGFEIEAKRDDSPLTLADRRSHDLITRELRTAFPDVHVLSEEGSDVQYEERSTWKRFWLVDPLDGTKEFIKRNGEFTINIALIEEEAPVFGVVFVPVSRTIYVASKGQGAFKARLPIGADLRNLEVSLSDAVRLPIGPGARKVGPVRVVASRSHFSDETRDFVEALETSYGSTEIVNAGSSVKFCIVAEGGADVYPRFGPTMEWDTAAGQMVAEESGCSVLRGDSNRSLSYNKHSLLNPWFVVGRDPYVTIS